MAIFVVPSSDLRTFNRSDPETHRVRNTTYRDDTGPALHHRVPLIGLLVTVTAGMTLGLWMVFTALTAAPTSPQSATGHGPDETQGPAHGHADAGVVAMPGLDTGASRTPSTAAGAAHAGSHGTGDMAGLSGEEMAGMEGMTPGAPEVAPSPTQLESGDAMAGMSDEDMAAAGHTADAHGPAADGVEPGRPLGATLAGFGLVNVAVLIGALIGRRRARQQRSGQHRDRAPTRRAAATRTDPAAGVSTVSRSTASAGSLS